MKNQEAHDSLEKLIHGLEDMTLGTNVAAGVHVHGQHGADETGTSAAEKHR